MEPLSDPVSTSPLVFREPHPERDEILMTGDAAGFVDPFVGDGISLALRSGTLAGECLIPFFAGRIALRQAACDYRSEYEQRLSPVFRTVVEDSADAEFAAEHANSDPSLLGATARDQTLFGAKTR